MPEDVKPVGGLKPIAPAFQGIKPVGNLKPIGSSTLNEPSPENKVIKPEDVLNNLETDNEHEKEMLKQLAKDVNDGYATHQDLVDAILTVQGKHSKQGGKKNYYVETTDQNVVIPKPLADGEKAPKDNTEIFNETSWYEDLGNSLLRGSSKLGEALAKTPAFIYDVAAIPQNLIAKYTGLNVGASSGEFAKLTDLPDNAVADYYKEQSQILQDKFVQQYDKGITDYVANGQYKKAFGLLSNAIVESAPVTIGLATANAGGVGALESILGGGAVFGAQKKAELDENAPNMDEQQKMAVALSNGLFEGIFEQFGITKLGGIAKDALLKSGEKEAYELALDGFKETYRPVITKYLGTSGEEALSEAATQFAQNVVDKYSGYKPDMELKDGVVDAAIIGFGAGAGYGLLTGASTEEVQKRKIERAAQQNKELFEIVQKGNDAVVGFKAEIFNARKNGKLTQEEANKAITKINAYKDYNDMLGSLKMEDGEKRSLFDLSFQKQNLETEIAGVKDPKKLNPIEQGQYAFKEKVANDLQKQINEIILKAQVREETNLPKKTIEDVVKLENPKKEKPKEGEPKPKVNPVLQAILDRNKKEVSKKEAPEEKRSYEEIPAIEFNKPNKITGGYRTVHKKAVEFLEKQPNKTMVGRIVEKPFEYGGKKNKTYGVELPDGKVMRFSSSMERPEGFRGHMRTEHLIDEKDLIGFPIGLKVEEIPALEEGDKPKKVIKAFNANTGKFVGYMKETNTGKNTAKEYSQKQIDYLEHLGTVSEPPIDGTLIPAKPQPNKPIDVQTYVKQNIEALKHDEDSDYDPYLEESGLYQKHFTEQYEKQFGKTVGAEEATARGVKEGDGQGAKTRKGVKGTPKARRKIKDPRYKKALAIEPNTAHEAVLQYFIGGGKINSSAIKELYKNPKQEILARVSYLNKNAPSIEGVAHYIWEQYNQRWDDTVIKDEVENVVNGYLHPTKMAEALLEAHDENKFTPNENVVIQAMEQAEAAGLTTQLEDVIDEAEKKTDEQLTKDETWEDIKDIISRKEGDEDVFQKKSAELEYAESELKKAERELKASKTAFDSKRKELGKEINNDQEDLFGERKSTEGAGLFDERVDLNAYESVIEPFKQRYDNAVKEFQKWDKKVKELINKEDSQTSLFQQGTEKRNEDIRKVVERIQKVMPRIKVVYDEKLDAKGKWSPKSRTLSVNPYYATKDTPIHEAGHILIDAMGGYSNRVIRSAIEQLKNSPLWAEIAGKYPVTESYTEEDLGKEILAEAIGREGAGIFNNVTAQNRFKQLLNYIFDWLKRNLGLEKNIAKNLAKQIIAGINVDRVVGGKEQLQQKTTFDEFRKQKGREQEDKDLATLYDALENEEDAEVIEQIEAAISVIEENIDNDRAEFEKFQKGIGNVEKIANAASLKDYTLDELIEAYNDARNWGGFADEVMLNNAKMRIANYLNEVGKERLSKHTKFIAENANKKDLHWLDVWFKTLGHINQDFPELQEFYKIFNESWLEMMTERNEKKSELERLGKAVIKEYNKKHGVGGTAVSMFTSNAAKYFEYLEQAGKYRTSTAGLSKAQIELLNFMKNLVKERQTQDEDGNLVENEILKIDKGFKENWKDEGLIPAISYYMGGNNQDTEITYTNPNTGKQEKATYKDAQKAILSYAKKGLAQKGIAMGKLLQAAYKAKKAGEKSNYGLNYNGQLTSKFDQPREKDRGYSKDFYSAAMNFIDDQTHIKYMGKLVPLVDSIEQFYKYLGFEQGKSFGNTLKFIEQWKSQMIYQRKGETDPILDKLLQFFRRLTSMTVMGFNWTAGVMNIAIGNYNNWRAESAPLILKGNKRLFGKDGLNKYGIDLLNKYNVVSQDFDSNPKPFAGKIFDMLAYGATRFGEYQIQGSMFLGQLTDKEWDSFEYKDGKLQVKPGIDEKELKKKMLQYKDRVSDIQGKYDTKDRINFMRFEHGKSVLQFKTWIPAYMKARFGERYIDANNVEHVGSWRTLVEQGFADLRKQMGTKEWWTSKETMANLKGLMMVTSLLILANSGDDEDKKRKKNTLSAENALGQMLFLLDPNQAKYMIKSPVASLGTVEKFITAAEDLMKGDINKFEKDVTKVIPYNKAITQTKDLVGNK